jgi:hypothetical protein
MAAVQFLAFDRDITPNMLRQGTALLEELKDIRQMLQEY